MKGFEKNQAFFPIRYSLFKGSMLSRSSAKMLTLVSSPFKINSHKLQWKLYMLELAKLLGN